jgi:hypothetical protein
MVLPLALAPPQGFSGNEITVLIAAGIAAIASLTSMVLNLRAHRLGELRAANRRLLDPHVARLGAGLFRLVALSREIARESSPEAARRWRELAQQVERRLERARIEVRYPLWGLDGAMATLARLPEWIDASRGAASRQRDLLARGAELQASLDRAILSSFQKGRVPSRWTRATVGWRASRLQRAWDDLSRAGGAG